MSAARAMKRWKSRSAAPMRSHAKRQRCAVLDALGEYVMPVQNLTPILNVTNIPDSMAWFEKLGWRKGFVWPDASEAPGFGSVCSGKAEIFLCHGGQGSL